MCLTPLVIIFVTGQKWPFLWMVFKAFLIWASPLPVSSLLLRFSEQSDSLLSLQLFLPRMLFLNFLAVLFPLHSLGLSSSLISSWEPCTPIWFCASCLLPRTLSFPLEALITLLVLIIFMTLRCQLELFYMSIFLLPHTCIGGLIIVINMLLYNHI